MRFQKLGFSLRPELKTSLTEQITQGLVRLIQEGKLKAGDALPSSRILAEDFGVDRSTVLAALNEAKAEGWIETRPSSGTFVAALQPDRTPIAWGTVPGLVAKAPEVPGFDLPSSFSPLTPLLPGPLNLGHSARLDARLAPVELLAKAYQRGVRLHGAKLMEYGEPRGHPLLREEIANMLARRRGLAVGSEQILITRGNRMGLNLVTTALLSQGGLAAVEDPCHPSIREAFRQIGGAELIPIPVDAGGISVESLERLLASRPLRLLHLTPHSQDPTGVMLENSRRKRVLELAQEHRFAIIEDGSDFEHHYEGAAPLPLACGDTGGNVIYLASFSRMFAPGLRLGFLVAPKDVIDRLARIRHRMEWQGDRALEWAMADLLRDGAMDRHAFRSRKVYQERRDQLLASMRVCFGPRLQLNAPAAGLSLWVPGTPSFPISSWIEACQRVGITMPEGRSFDFAGQPLDATKIGFAALDTKEISEVADRFRKALAQFEA